MQEASAGLREESHVSRSLSGADAEQTAGLPNHGRAQSGSGKRRDVVLPIREFRIEREVLVEVVEKSSADSASPFADPIQARDIRLHTHFIPWNFLVVLPLRVKPLGNQECQSQKNNCPSHELLLGGGDHA
jgi:hypothetical protein